MCKECNILRAALGKQLGWESLHHQPYSPDLEPSDYHGLPRRRVEVIKTKGEYKHGSNYFVNKYLCCKQKFTNKMFLDLKKHYSVEKN